ncbi:Pc20g01000 [Penicillium rubens Wisconsin 54-1255]|uniref:Pc20g01000 protein n=1 Tax=Penicillium rubens (strain ATCC 28089 / DSM 1075 / NRRL 1951 / Wisconsin 54-1255) TaxID=500485 RepID=B6HGR4_PENRW|nr:Pc20g01000 [Penicillium rubens Wisconsin 54-1255]
MADGPPWTKYCMTDQGQRLTGATGNTRKPYSFVTTGLWGCGAFGGNRQVKAIIQWYAASLANVLELRYVLGGEEQKVFRDVFDVLVRLGTDLQNGKAAVPKPDEIFEYVLQSL